MSPSSPVSASKDQTMGTQDEFSTAMAEDLAEWMSHLVPDLACDLTGDNFFDKISDGTLLCHYATELHRRMIESKSGSKKGGKQRLHGVRIAGAKAVVPSEPPAYHSRGHKWQNLAGGSFWARDNIANFLKWCRSVGFPDYILFETEDLVSRKCLRSVSVCLLELGRLGGKFGMEVPEVVHLEKQIDAELAAEHCDEPEGEGKDRPFMPKNKIPVARMSSLDVIVDKILTECTCNPPFSMVRVGEGRYVYGEKSTPIFVRLTTLYAKGVIGRWSSGLYPVINIDLISGALISCLCVPTGMWTCSRCNTSFDYANVGSKKEEEEEEKIEVKMKKSEMTLSELSSVTGQQ
ncbi:unnamed protein product [Dibothriocephalus latus]|uniref:Calponin-homology (CH) domain-containing protein n=1 Tax=Dibothriocephalus latus TaxID=60516 RepID=A0A3P6TP45_DIBLA|nr:unnamed protein product [Dibothriocephalus latus]